MIFFLKRLMALKRAVLVDVESNVPSSAAAQCLGLDLLRWFSYDGFLGRSLLDR